MSRIVRAAAVLGTVALCASLAACSSGGGGGNLASVNGQTITHADFDRRLEASPNAKQVLNQMVQQKLIDEYAQDKHVDITQAQIDKREAEIRAKYPPGQFDQIVKQQGLTEQEVQNILRQQLVLEQAVAPQVHVSDADVKNYFLKNHATFDKPEQVRARHILVADPQTAAIVLAKLKAGGSWDALAKQYSTDPSSKEKGGELGFFGKGQMVPAFQDAAFAAKVGAIVGPVKSPFGYHIIQVEEKKPPTTASFASVKDQIKTQLTQQQEGQAVPVFLQGLRTAATITVYDDRYKDLFPPPSPAAAAATTAPAPPPATTAPTPAPSGT